MFALERALIAQMRPVAMCCAKDTLPKLPVPSTLSILKSFRLQGGRLLDGLFSCNGKAAHVEHHRNVGAAAESAVKTPEVLHRSAPCWVAQIAVL